MELIDRDVLFNSFNDCSCECEVCQYSLDGLPCGLIENAPTVKAIPKADYEARLKADMVAMLTEIQLEIEEINHNEYCKNLNWCDSPMDRVQAMRLEEIEVKKIIQQKINSLKESENE